MWISTLRHSGKLSSEGKPKVSVISDLPLAFKFVTMPSTKKDIELIKKPQLTNLMSQMQTEQSKYKSRKLTRNHHNLSQGSLNSYFSVHVASYESSFANATQTSFSQSKIYQKKLKQLESTCKESIPLISDQVDFDNLAVVGSSQLEREALMLAKDRQSN